MSRGFDQQKGNGSGRTTARREGETLPPRWLDPIMALAEAIDRRRRHITPIREGGVLSLELRRYPGKPIQLRDGCVVERGTAIGAMHFRNDRVREVVTPGWQIAGYREGRRDLAALADWMVNRERLGDPERPVAFLGTTILAPLGLREGWQTRRVPWTWRTRLDAWWMRWLMARFNRAGRERVLRAHHPLEVTELWLCAHELVKQYGLPDEAADGANGADGADAAAGAQLPAPNASRKAHTSPRA